MSEIIFVTIAAFIAGFVDAVAGGGGLIQIPALFIAFPQTAAAALLGTNKIPSFAGTSLAAYKYTRRVAVQWKSVLMWMVVCALSAIGGSYMVTIIDTAIVKPIILIALITVAIYTYANKNFGTIEKVHYTGHRYLMIGIMIAIIVGFYDGFLGPGSGNFLILGFIGLLGFDFLKASTHAKLLNLASNFGSILLFGFKGAMIWSLVVPMMIANVLGSMLGTKMAFLKGNKFIRIVFICAISLAIVRYSWDVF